MARIWEGGKNSFLDLEICMAHGKADALANDLGGQKFDEFWKSVNKINQSSQLHTTTIDGITGEANIAEHWRTHFHGILNTNICDQTLKSSILGTRIMTFSMMPV